MILCIADRFVQTAMMITEAQIKPETPPGIRTRNVFPKRGNYTDDLYQMYAGEIRRAFGKDT